MIDAITQYKLHDLLNQATACLEQKEPSVTKAIWYLDQAMAYVKYPETGCPIPEYDPQTDRQSDTD